MALMIPLMALSIPFFAIWIKHREKALKYQAEIAQAGGGDRSADVARLEERVRVLERIVTDRRMDLAGEIEALRDPAPQISAAKRESVLTKE